MVRRIVPIPRLPTTIKAAPSFWAVLQTWSPGCPLWMMILAETWRIWNEHNYGIGSFNLKILAKYSFLLQLFFRNNKLFAFLKIINGRHVTRKIFGKTRNPGSNTLERITTEKRKKTLVKEKRRKTPSQCLARLSTGNIQLVDRRRKTRN